MATATRRRAPMPSSSHADLFADMSVSDLTAELAARERRAVSVNAAANAGMASVPSDLLIPAQTYQGRVIKLWEAYNTDPLFGELVNRFCDYAANGSRWEVSVPLDDDKSGPISWLRRLATWAKSKEKKVEREEDVWNDWFENINKNVPGVVPGGNIVSAWAVKNLLLSGMFIPHWEYGDYIYGKERFRMPIRITCHPANMVTLARLNDDFVQETAYLYKPTSGMKLMAEGQQMMAPERMADNRPTAAQEELPLVWTRDDPPNEAMLLKYNWSPADLITVRNAMRSITGHGTYPRIPFNALMPQFTIRQQLFAADNAILTGVNNYLKIWKIGSKEVPPQPPLKNKQGQIEKPGTVSVIRQQIMSQQSAGTGVEIFVPYWVDLEMKMPETQTLLNEQKYWASTLEIFQAFGIFFSRSIGGRNEKMEKINIANFEQFLFNVRFHVRAFWVSLAQRTMELNGRKFTSAPMWVPMPLNTKDEKFRSDIREMLKLGRVSTESAQRYHHLDPDVETRRTATEIATDQDDLNDAAVPLSYVQQSQPAPDIGGENAQPLTPKGRVKVALGRPNPEPRETAQSPGTQRGRPTDGNAERTVSASRRKRRGGTIEYEIEKKDGKTKLRKRRVEDE